MSEEPKRINLVDNAKPTLDQDESGHRFQGGYIPPKPPPIEPIKPTKQEPSKPKK